ncbi:hypothetical protein CMUS01_07437 [Colletotrichum musicola]|uniref:Uncharacterized protein n=1 Tax=Colletotrichum musicola TaxID=2175873 RepID=A0A8H6KGL4_9PEZI|nr:hypothetical protein CMUS01_07437 [Colletotrichum musicola]
MQATFRRNVTIPITVPAGQKQTLPSEPPGPAPEALPGLAASATRRRRLRYLLYYTLLDASLTGSSASNFYESPPLSGFCLHHPRESSEHALIFCGSFEGEAAIGVPEDRVLDSGGHAVGTDRYTT